VRRSGSSGRRRRTGRGASPLRLFGDRRHALAFYRLSHRCYRGQLVVDLGALYAAQRFLLETLRTDPRGPVILGLSSPQLLALLFAILAASARLVLAREAPP
jgi:hypothetical protein